MPESIKQLSSELNISTQAIRERMMHFKSFRYNHTNIISHRLIIDDKGVMMLKNYHKYSNGGNYYNSNHVVTPLVEQLRSDLKHERKQNDYLQGQNNRLTLMLEQSNQSNQRLLKSTEQDVKHHGLLTWIKGLFDK